MRESPVATKLSDDKGPVCLSITDYMEYVKFIPTSVGRVTQSV